MKKHMQSVIEKHHTLWGLIAAVLCLLIIITPAYAQDPASVQLLTGETGSGVGVVYNLPNLQRGQTLYVYAQGISGNLDPLTILVEGEVDQATVRADFGDDVKQALAAGRDPLDVIPEFANKSFLAWDDDSGQGYDAAFEVKIPADGDYQLTVTSSPSAQTFGDFQLLLGLNKPAVLSGQAKPTGKPIAELNQTESRFNVAVEEKSGSFTEDKRSTFFTLRDVEAGDTLYATVTATSGDLAPILVLEDFGAKPLKSGNFSGKESEAVLEYTFAEGGSNYRLRLQACCNNDPVTTGDYQLVVGINEPKALIGQAMLTPHPALKANYYP